MLIIATDISPLVSKMKENNKSIEMLPNSTLAINDMDMDFKVEITKKK